MDRGILLEVRLVRTASSEEGTFGVLHNDQRPLCVTCELPTPIPAGIYDCIPHNGERFQNVWEITKVPGHSAVLIHNGNTIDDTHLCVLVGKAYEKIHGKQGITNSVLTLNELRGKLPPTFKLSIINAY